MWGIMSIVLFPANIVLHAWGRRLHVCIGLLFLKTGLVSLCIFSKIVQHEDK